MLKRVYCHGRSELVLVIIQSESLLLILCGLTLLAVAKLSEDVFLVVFLLRTFQER